MPWSTTEVTRESLYEAVWSEPVTKVAKRYGVSDVALRKVCVKLSVPTPPLGYWAKRAHGKATARPVLPARATVLRHVFRRWVDPVDEELQSRLAAAHADAPPPAAPMQADVPLQMTPSEWHKTVKRTASALRNEFPRLPESWRVARGPGLFNVYASKSSAERALALLDLLVRLCSHAGIAVTSDAGEQQPARVVIDGRAFTFRVVEQANRVERALTDAERQALHGNSGPYLPNRVTKEGTGRLRLEVLGMTGLTILTRNDTRNQQLEDVLHDVPASLQRHVVEQAVRDAVAKERAERAEQERRRRQALIDAKQAQLKRLENTEKEAEQWLRARRLGRYAQALLAEARAGETTAERRERLLEKAKWTENAAAWLNPLVARHWPEVDDAPHSAYTWG